MSISTAGSSRRRLSIAISDCPPASTLAASPYSARTASTSATLGAAVGGGGGGGDGGRRRRGEAASEPFEELLDDHLGRAVEQPTADRRHLAADGDRIVVIDARSHGRRREPQHARTRRAPERSRQRAADPARC